MSIALIIGGAVYWVVKKKLQDEFCLKKECMEMREQQRIDCQFKHTQLTKQFGEYRQDIGSEIREIKEMVKEIRGWVFEWMQHTKNKGG